MVKLEPYNSEWKTEFEKEKAILSSILNNFILDIQHIGSTSIEGCPAKPVIDIFIGIESLEYGKQLIPILLENGYIYKPNNGIPDEIYFKKRKNNLTTHHIHIAPINGEVWKNQILFRDYMRLHPEKLQEYIELKQQLAFHFPEDRDSYSQGKNEFIKNVIFEAKKIIFKS